MRKFLFILLMFLFNFSYAQYAKGSYIISADLNTYYNLNDRGDSYAKYLYLGATGSIFINDHTVIGVHLFESFNTLVWTSNKMYGAGLVTKYYQKFNNEAGFVCSSSLSYQYKENIPPLLRSTSQYLGLTSLNLSAGLYCFVYKAIAVEATYTVLNVQYIKGWNDENLPLNQKTYTNDGFNMNLNFANMMQLGNLNFSVLYFFNKK